MMRRILWWLGIVVATGCIAGVVSGIAARLAMRVVALTDGAPGTLFTAEGTLAIVIVAVMFDSIVAAVYSPFGLSGHGSVMRNGIMLGGILILLPGALVAAEVFRVGLPVLNLPMFAGVAVVNGLAISATMAGLDRWRKARTTPQEPTAADQASSRRSGPNAAFGM